jgi:hypothetical protein
MQMWLPFSEITQLFTESDFEECGNKPTTPDPPQPFCDNLKVDLLPESRYQVSVFPKNDVHYRSGEFPNQGATRTSVPQASNTNAWKKFYKNPPTPTSPLYPSSEYLTYDSEYDDGNGQNRLDNWNNPNIKADVVINFPAPTGQDRIIYVERWVKSGNNWVYNVQKFDGGIGCYKVNCSLSVVESPLGDNKAIANNQFFVNLSITNVGQTSLPGQYLGRNVRAVLIGSNGASWFELRNFPSFNKGQTRSTTFTLTAPAAISQPIANAFIQYNPGFDLGRAHV